MSFAIAFIFDSVKGGRAAIFSVLEAFKCIAWSWVPCKSKPLSGGAERSHKGYSCACRALSATPCTWSIDLGPVESCILSYTVLGCSPWGSQKATSFPPSSSMSPGTTSHSDKALAPSLPLHLVLHMGCTNWSRGLIIDGVFSFWYETPKNLAVH